MKLNIYSASLEASREVITMGDGLSASAYQAPPADPSQRGTEFRAVQGGSETVNGSALLVEAYAALWIILLGFLLISWRRQTRIDARVAELERAITAARGGSK
jgi:hypothetical protein